MMKTRNALLALLLVFAIVVATGCCVSTDEVTTPAGVNGDSSANNGEASSEKVEITIAETVLYEEGGIKVTATSFEDDLFGPEIKTVIENTSAKNVIVSAELVSVNGYMMSGASLYADVAAGKKANESMTFFSSELNQAGIDTIAQIEMIIKVTDADHWDVLQTSDLITLNTSAEGYEQPVDDSGDVIYDKAGIKIVCKGLKQDTFWDGTIVLYIENNYGKSITVYAENVSVNGFMITDSMWSELRDGMRIVDGLDLINLDEVELNSIDDVENIEFSLRIIDNKTWQEIETTDVITLTFE